MAELTYEQLRHKTLAELRDIAKGIEHEAVQGYTQMNKEHLIVALAKLLAFNTSTTPSSASTKAQSKHAFVS